MLMFGQRAMKVTNRPGPYPPTPQGTRLLTTAACTVSRRLSSKCCKELPAQKDYPVKPRRALFMKYALPRHNRP